MHGIINIKFEVEIYGCRVSDRETARTLSTEDQRFAIINLLINNIYLLTVEVGDDGA